MTSCRVAELFIPCQPSDFNRFPSIFIFDINSAYLRLSNDATIIIIVVDES